MLEGIPVPNRGYWGEDPGTGTAVPGTWGSCTGAIWSPRTPGRSSLGTAAAATALTLSGCGRATTTGASIFSASTAAATLPTPSSCPGFSSWAPIVQRRGTAFTRVQTWCTGPPSRAGQKVSATCARLYSLAQPPRNPIPLRNMRKLFGRTQSSLQYRLQTLSSVVVLSIFSFQHV